LKFRSVDGISKSNPANRAIRRVIGFIARQKHNYRVAITRAAANNFLLNLTAQYDSIYTVGLGADSVELGSISSIGNGIGAILSSPIGWLMDRYGLKRLYLLGMALMAGSAMVYALASSWEAIIVAMVLFSVSTRFIGTGCSVICADSVRNKDRVTAQNICVTIASLLAMLSPLVAARLVTLYGGLNVEGIRPLYTIRFVGYLLVLFFLTAQLKDLQPASETNIDSKSGFVGDFKQLFVGKGPLKRWLLVASLTWFPMAMTTPFLQLFAHQTKGADQYLLSIMATATVLTQVLFGIPLGRLADKIGRKKVIYLLTPLWYASYILLIFSFNAFTLILAGALQTFYFIASGVTNAMTLELVPVNRMGRWSGLIGLFRGLVTIPAPILGGLIWDNLNPMYVFLLPIGVDFLLKLPLLATIPETLSVAPDEK
jgi:DHA1 family tetracycline resistance protein-like MFS transporter